MGQAGAVHMHFWALLRRALGAEHEPLLQDFENDKINAAVWHIIERERLEALVVPVYPAALTHRQNRSSVVNAQARAVLQQQIYQRVSVVLQQKEIQHLVCKGLAADALFWQGHGKRGSSDIDVVIHPQDRSRMHIALLEMGATLAEATAQPSSSALWPAASYQIPIQAHAQTQKQAQKYIWLDVHWDWLTQPLFSVDMDGVMERRQNMRGSWGKKAISMTIPAWEDWWAFMGGNLIQDGLSGRYKLALDAWMLLATSMDAKITVQRAVNWGTATGVWVLVWLLQKHFAVLLQRDAVRCQKMRQILWELKQQYPLRASREALLQEYMSYFEYEHTDTKSTVLQTGMVSRFIFADETHRAAQAGWAYTWRSVVDAVSVLPKRNKDL